MFEVISPGFFGSDQFMPHGHCFLWRPDILWLNTLSDAVIGVSYFMIPVFLFIFYFRRKDLNFSWVLILFSLFILGCGSTHFADIWTTWNPNYGIAGLLKAFTAIVSIMTALVMWRVVPKVLAMPTAKQVAEANARLQAEIADRIAAEEGWRLAKEAADLANAAKTAFLANVSHEIRTPLGAVLGFSELLKSSELTAERKKELHAGIKRNADLLLNVVNDILDLSKIEAGKIQITKKPVPIAEIVGEIGASLRLLANEKSIAFHSGLDKNLPVLIYTDPVRLRQILLNVLANAVKFTERGMIELTVRRVERANNDPLISFEVRDTGIGIAPENTKKLFEPFHQADASTSRRFGGTGLGLALSRRLASALGGNIELTMSRLGWGTVFTITIDSELSQMGAASASAVSRPMCSLTGCSGRLDGWRILLVDDSPDNLFLVSSFLERSGADVVTAGGGKEAIMRAERERFDVILMDLQMPEVDGFMATDEIRRQGYHGPVVALTAHGFSEVKERCIAHGLDDHVLKPVEQGELNRVLLKYCRRLLDAERCRAPRTACAHQGAIVN